jgi:hypothetical protein
MAVGINALLVLLWDSGSFLAGHDGAAAATSTSSAVTPQKVLRVAFFVFILAVINMFQQTQTQMRLRAYLN